MKPREHLGYFEDYLLRREGCFPKWLGCLISKDNPDARKLGSDGMKDKTITAPITLKKGHREVMYRASEKKPLKVTTILNRLEGREL